MAPENVGQSLGAQRAGVALIIIPRRKQHCRNSPQYDGIPSECKNRPFLHDIACTGTWIPGQSCKAIEICHCEWMSQPVVVESYVGNSHQATHGAIKSLSCDRIHDW